MSSNFDSEVDDIQKIRPNDIIARTKSKYAVHVNYSAAFRALRKVRYTNESFNRQSYGMIEPYLD